MKSEILIFSYVWKMKYLLQHECKTSRNEVDTCSRKKIKLMLLDSLDKSILITRGRKASIPTYFLYEELSHREKQPSSIKKYIK